MRLNTHKRRRLATLPACDGSAVVFLL